MGSEVSDVPREPTVAAQSLKIRNWKLLALIIPSRYIVLKYLWGTLALYGSTVSCDGSKDSSSEILMLCMTALEMAPA